MEIWHFSNLTTQTSFYEPFGVEEKLAHLLGKKVFLSS